MTSTTAQAELLPCPFCGGTKIDLSEGTTFRWRYIGCSECGAQLEFRSDNRFEPTEETWRDAAERWNNRPAAETGPSASSHDLDGYSDHKYYTREAATARPSKSEQFFANRELPTGHPDAAPASSADRAGNDIASVCDTLNYTIDFLADAVRVCPELW